MLEAHNILDIDPFSLSQKKKEILLLQHLNSLVKHHQNSCDLYKNFLSSHGLLDKEFEDLESLPFLPVRAFKELDLMSITEQNIFKVLTSSGTTGNKVSKIYLDKLAASSQTKALIKIMQSFIGKHRMPMLIIDSDDVISNRKSFSARGAAILGFSNFGKNHTYILDSNLNLKVEVLKKFLLDYHDQPFLIFGFTYIVWSSFFEVIKELNLDIDLSNGTLIHGGGWKKMQSKSVDNSKFKSSLQDQFNLMRVHNYYGMVEQIGSVYMECEDGYLHTPVYSEILIRDPIDWSIKQTDQVGLVELVSLLPNSYPGHVIISEDLGCIISDQKCKCGRWGKRFKIIGRVAQSEPRGCGDTLNNV